MRKEKQAAVPKQEQTAEYIAESIGIKAYYALLEEVYTTPKPGLVDLYSCGAHTDMDVQTFERSAEALRPWFIRMAAQGYLLTCTREELFTQIRQTGIMAEKAMFQATDGVNTHKGTGLGLALVEQIVTSHKGYVFAESQPGVGSCFHIGLPVLQADQPEETVQVGERHEIRMVFADDNAKVLELLRRSFDKIGIQIQTCMTIEELSANLAEKEADVLVIEENIEGQSGVDFCMSIAGKYPKMLKLVSIESISREIVEAKKKGIIHGYVEKTLSDRNVLEAVRECQKEQFV